MEQTFAKQKHDSLKRKSKNLICLEQNIELPSNLLQQKKNILQQFRLLKTSQNSRVSTPRENLAVMSKTFSISRDKNTLEHSKFQTLVQERIISLKQNGHQKVIKNPLYKRLTNIQAESKELVGVSFSKILSRMLVIQEKDETHASNQYRRKKNLTIDTKLKSIPNYQCLESKLFAIECPQNRYEHFDQNQRNSNKRSLNVSPQKTGQPQSNRIFRRYFNPHGQKTDLVNSLDTVLFDQRYIYRNGKKAECKRIHNFYTSNMFKKSYEKHMRTTIDSFHKSTKSAKH